MNKMKILNVLSNLLKNTYKDNIVKVVLFGSQASAKTFNSSDYDILIVVKKDFDWRFENNLLSLCYEIDLEYNIVTDVKIISINELNSLKGKQPFIQNALETGIAV